MIGTRRAIAIGLLLAASPFYAIAPAADGEIWAEAAPVDGRPFKARLQSIAANGMVDFAMPRGETKKLSLADLCWWGQWREPPPRPQLVLVDGSLIVADAIGIDKERLAADWGVGGEFKLPLEWLGGIVFAPPIDKQQADRLRYHLAPGGSEGPRRESGKDQSGDAAKDIAAGDTGRADAANSDRLILLNGDELTGEVLALGENAVKFKTPAGEISVGRDKIAAVAFNPSLAAKPKTGAALIAVGLSDGSRVIAASLEVERAKAKLTTASGLELTLPTVKIVALQPLHGRAKYISDLKPSGYQHIPFLQLKWPSYADRNVLGGQLRAGGRLYLKGLGVHAAARLTYDLDKPYRALAADAAIDDQTAGRGSAVFRVYIDDGSGEWQLRYESPIVRGGAPPSPISVDLSGVKRLSLLVDFADHGDEQAHADWLNARLLP